MEWSNFTGDSCLICTFNVIWYVPGIGLETLFFQKIQVQACVLENSTLKSLIQAIIANPPNKLAAASVAFESMNSKSFQILFIGDSTNRGIMHYVMEQANDSLTEWDKTHNIKIYNNINHEQTTVSFAYYPQFWLPANQRPVFDKALYQLIKK